LLTGSGEKIYGGIEMKKYYAAFVPTQNIEGIEEEIENLLKVFNFGCADRSEYRVKVQGTYQNEVSIACARKRDAYATCRVLQSHGYECFWYDLPIITS
jgi:hypothetical protein